MTSASTGPIRVGIAGLGRSGYGRHIPTAEAMGDRFKVVAVHDPNQSRQAEAQSRVGCRTHAEFAQLLVDDGVELVVLSTPSHLHADQAVDAMRAGKHVMVDKPFAISLEDADRMIAVSRETGQILTGGQDQRYAGDFLKVREVIQSGKLGQILSIRILWHWFRRRWDWQTLKEFGGGSLNNDGSHVVDQAILLFGDAEPEVFCHMERTPLSSGDAEDHVKIILRSAQRSQIAPLIDMEFSNAVAYPRERWLVVGTQGGLVGTPRQLRWKHLDPKYLPERPVSREPTPDRSYNREALTWDEEVCELPEESYLVANHRLYGGLYAALRQGVPLAVTAESIRRQIAVLERCRELSPA